jgi:uncharacterized membrane protein YkoI
MKRFLALAVVGFVVTAAVAQAHSSSAKPEHKITYESAKLIAEHKVPKGTMSSHTIVHDHDHLVYAFGFTEPGKTGVKEVDVDARNGKIVKNKHESIQNEEKDRLKEAQKH